MYPPGGAAPNSHWDRPGISLSIYKSHTKAYHGCSAENVHRDGMVTSPGDGVITPHLSALSDAVVYEASYGPIE